MRAEMVWAWGEYRRLAWGKDEIRPVSGGASTFPLQGHHLGLSLIEALDTLWAMGLEDEFHDGVAWVRANADWDVDGEVSGFETSIRLVGGLLSAHHACGDPMLLAKARDLADRLLPAFATPTGTPYRYVNLRTDAVRDAGTNPAEVGGYVPEWGTLMHDICVDAIMARQADRRGGRLWLADVDVETGAVLNTRQDELAAFFGGLLAQGGRATEGAA